MPHANALAPTSTQAMRLALDHQHEASRWPGPARFVPMAWENITTLAVALAALIVSVVSVRYSKNSADASKRSADAAERQAAAAEASVPPPPPPVRWVVSQTGRNAYVLRNIGTGPAADVKINAMDELLRHPEGETLEAPQLAPGQSITFLLVDTDQSPSVTEIEVCWRGSDGWVLVPMP